MDLVKLLTGKEKPPDVFLKHTHTKQAVLIFFFFFLRCKLKLVLILALTLGGIGDRRRRGRQTMRWLDGISELMDLSMSEPREFVMDREAWHATIHGVAKSRKRLSD